MIDLRRYNFGAHVGTVASLSLLVGLEASPNEPNAVIESLLIVSTAANLESAFGIYMYEHGAGRTSQDAFISAASNAATWLAISVTFVAIMLIAPSAFWASWLAIAWGLSLLAILGYMAARRHKHNVASEIAKHVLVGILGLTVSEAISIVIPLLF